MPKLRPEINSKFCESLITISKSIDEHYIFHEKVRYVVPTLPEDILSNFYKHFFYYLLGIESHPDVLLVLEEKNYPEDIINILLSDQQKYSLTTDDVEKIIPSIYRLSLCTFLKKVGTMKALIAESYLYFPIDKYAVDILIHVVPPIAEFSVNGSVNVSETLRIPKFIHKTVDCVIRSDNFVELVDIKYSDTIPDFLNLLLSAVLFYHKYEVKVDRLRSYNMLTGVECSTNIKNLDVDSLLYQLLGYDVDVAEFTPTEEHENLDKGELEDGTITDFTDAPKEIRGNVSEAVISENVSEDVSEGVSGDFNPKNRRRGRKYKRNRNRYNVGVENMSFESKFLSISVITTSLLLGALSTCSMLLNSICGS